MNVKVYTLNDMAKVGCNDCRGCFSCCQGMGDSIVLDPYDIWQLERNLNTTFASLMQKQIELHIEDGLILPNLKMQTEADCCSFLDENGRCAIHKFRPGLCRLFPLGRKYENDKLYYFVLEDACVHTAHTKMKIKKWLEVDDGNGKKYENFLITWHELRKKLLTQIAEGNDEIIKNINMKMLHIFYEEPYKNEDFYEQFEERVQRFGKYIVGLRYETGGESV